MAEAALIEVSIMGAAVVAPDRWEAYVGTRVEIFWEDFSAWVIVRRATSYHGAAGLVVYGVEYADTRAPLGVALYDRFVGAPQRVETEVPGETDRDDRDRGLASGSAPNS